MAAEENPARTADRLPLPAVSLDGLEPAVREQIQQMYETADASRRDSAANTTQARAIGDLGHVYHAYDLVAAAEICYRNAIALEPARFEWNYSLAYLLQNDGRPGEALPLYEALENQAPTTGLGCLVAIRRGECWQTAGDLTRAREFFEQARRLQPDEPTALARLGEIALQEKKYNEAVTLLSAALAAQPDANKLHYPLALAYRELGEPDRARSHLALFGKVGIQPSDPLKRRLDELVLGYRVHLLAGRRAFSAGRFEDAVREFRKASSADPKEPGARINLAVALSQSGRHQDAVAELQTILESTPDHSGANYNLGLIHTQLGDYAQAVKHLEITVDQNPDDSEAHLALADAFLRQKKFTTAFDHYRTVTRLSPERTVAWLAMSALLKAADQYQESLDVLSKAHSLLPHDPAISLQLAGALAASPKLELREGARALSLAMQADQETPTYASARVMAMAYAQLDRCDDAEFWMKKAITLAEDEGQSSAVLSTLKHNLAHFQENRPCRIPGGLHPKK